MCEGLAQGEFGIGFGRPPSSGRDRRSKADLNRRQPAEKAPGQPGVVGQNDALSYGNHEGYIANRPGGDNEAAAKLQSGHGHEKGADMAAP
jgi:hypothetical protein